MADISTSIKRRRKRYTKDEELRNENFSKDFKRRIINMRLNLGLLINIITRNILKCNSGKTNRYMRTRKNSHSNKFTIFNVPCLNIKFKTTDKTITPIRAKKMSCGIHFTKERLTVSVMPGIVVP
ncbi:hypothetical protein WUBG_06088 [Wuchereria bancrofti]|uniref:Uncharacterized protein n=1 Tax=Wuchereria bancrofti TaxID=6293 RepID=J9F6K0_WUCBA|nr:hypothetical protein WUBG_06088 [Wuchereria bancrofti]